MSAHNPGNYRVEYNYSGETYGLSIWAESWEDAEARLKRLGNYGKVIGSNAITIPTIPGGGIIARLLVWWLNLTGRRP